MKTNEPNHKPAHMRDVPLASETAPRTSWRGVTRRAILAATCAATAATLMFPSASFAAEWVSVGDTKYETATSDEAGTWSWDGADSMELNNYSGSGITAAGKLDVTYSGENTIASDTTGINVKDGEAEDAELTITGSEDSSLTVEAEKKAIRSEGDITISGEGTVSATSSSNDAICSHGDLTISDGATVSATSTSDENHGLCVHGDLTIEDSDVEATSKHAIFSSGDIEIANSDVKAEGQYTGIIGYGSLTADNSRLTASATDESDEDEIIGVYIDGGPVTIKNGSLVEALANGSKSAYGIWAYNYEEAGGHIAISDSTVTAKAETTEPDEYWAVGILAETSDSSAPASIDISRSNVTAEGTGIAILSRNYALASTNPESGTITVKDSTITTPQGGKLAKYKYGYEVGAEGVGDGEEPGYYVDCGMTIVSADTNTDELITDESLQDAVVNKVVITADEAEPTPEIKPAGYVTPTGSGEKKALPQTGDASPAGLIASAIAGFSALATGLFMTSKRER